MQSVGLRGLAGLAAVLCGVLAGELGPAPDAPDTPIVTPRVIRPAVIEPRPASDRALLNATAARVLARPLFTETRRPAAPTTEPKEAAAVLPRLAGVIVGRSERMAIFAPVSGGRSLVVAEGGRIGDFVLRLIAPGEVTVTGADGTRLLRPSFDANPVVLARSPPTEPPTDPAAATAAARQRLMDLVLNGPRRQPNRQQ